MLSIATGVAIDSAVTFVTAPSLLVEYSTLDAIIASRLPPSLLYDFELYEPYITAPGALQPAGGVGLKNNTAVATGGLSAPCNGIQLGSIPDKIIVFAKPTTATTQGTTLASAQYPDVFLPIQSLSMNWGNRIALFSTMTVNDLYQMSVANGLKDSLYDFKFGSGSIVIIDVVNDVGLSAEETSNQINTYSTLSVNASFNVNNLTVGGQAVGVDYQVYVYVVKSGKMLLEGGQCQQILAGASPAQVLETLKSGDKVDGAELKDFDEAKGGSFMSGMMKLVNSGSNLLSRIKPEHLELAKKGFEMAKNLAGKGDGGALVAGKLGRVPRKRVY